MPPYLHWALFMRDKVQGDNGMAKKSLLHINVLGLKGIFFGLKSFLSQNYCQHVRIKSDNTTAIAYINNKGGVKAI